MSTPPEEPRYGTGYGGARYPLPPDGGQSAHGGGYPYGGPGGPPQGGGYSPYGPYTPPPAGLDKPAAPPRRPGVMTVGLVLQVLASLPFLAFGLLFLLVPLGPDILPPEVLDNPQLRDAGVTDVNLLVQALRLMGGVLAALAVIYVVLLVVGFTGRNWARILVAVMTAGFTVFLLLGVTSAAATDPLGAVVLLAPVVLAVAGLVTWFLPAANQWYARR